MIEFTDVIARPKFAKIITNGQARLFQTIASKFLRKIKTEEIPDIVRDTDDNYLLEIRRVCKADFLITGDSDLLVLGNYKGTQIVSMRQFINQ